MAWIELREFEVSCSSLEDAYEIGGASYMNVIRLQVYPKLHQMLNYRSIQNEPVIDTVQTQPYHGSMLSHRSAPYPTILKRYWSPEAWWKLSARARLLVHHPPR
jgi:hypothetical protein